MFCPKCGSTQSDELKFCKSCGSNLGVVREALTTGQAPSKFDWSNTWVAEMFQSSEQAVKKEQELKRLKGITPDVRRRNEIKAGVIVSSVGIGLMILLFFLMQGIILSGRPSPGEAEILSRIWIAGVIPFFVGLALIINGVFVSKLFSGNEKSEQTADNATTQLPGTGENSYLPPADTNELFPAGFSVTDETTRHLAESIKTKQRGS
jgi:hypothetical protein